jgi:hypothetical protein
MAGTLRVHPHQRTHRCAAVGRCHCLHRRSQRRGLGFGRDRVLQIDDYDAGARGGCLGEPFGAVTGNEQCGDCRGDSFGAGCREASCRRRHWKSTIEGSVDSSGRADSTPGR